MKDSRPPARSQRILTKWVDTFARANGEAPGRVRNWVSSMVVAGALERGGFVRDEVRFVVKGGVALELRLKGKARATRDLDLGVDAANGVPVDLLRSALAESYEQFRFRVRDDDHVMLNGAHRVSVSLGA